MPQLDQLSACPGCSEPLEEGDRFCCACGTDLAAAADLAASAAAPPPAAPAAPGAEAPGAQTGPPTVTLTSPTARSPYTPQAPAGPPPAAPPAPAAEAPTEGGFVPASEAPTAGDFRPAAEAPTEGDFTLPPAEELPLPPTTDAPAPAAGHEPAARVSAPGPPRPGTPDPRTLLDPGPGAAPDLVVEGLDEEAPSTVKASVGGAAPSGGLPSLVEGPGPVPATSSAAPAVAAAPAAPVAASAAEEGPETIEATCVACGTGAISHDGYCECCGHKQPRERDHMESELGTVAAATDRGLRHHRNEDSYAIVESATAAGSPATVAVVCDGVSSATRPDEASAAAARAAADALRDALPLGTPAQQAVHDALLTAAEAVNRLADDGPNEPAKNAPACTIVCALATEGILTIGWIGDSRAYWVPEDRAAPPARLTEDDSWAAQMVAAGLMDENEAYADARAHAITGWLGADAYELDPHTACFRPESPGVVVVCTDGLWNYAESAEQMAAVVPADARHRPLHTAQRLVGHALDRGGHDNVTVAVLPVPAPAGRTAPAPPA